MDIKNNKSPPVPEYQPGNMNSNADKKPKKLLTEKENLIKLGKNPLNESFSPRLLLQLSLKSPTRTTGLIVYVTTGIICVFFTLLCVVLAVWGENIIECQPVWVTIVVLLSIASFICIFLICTQPESSEAVSFKVPLLPVLPLISIFINIYFMMQLNEPTWIRFVVWMVIGFLIYFGYGIRNSFEAKVNLEGKRLKSRVNLKKV